jgi:hypothetical protein
MKNYKILTETPYCKTLVADMFEVFEESTNVIVAHCCNTQHVMGAGVAAVIRKRYPEAYVVDLATEKGPEKLGGFSYALIDQNNNRQIANLYGQNLFGSGGRDVSYDALYNALNALYQSVELPHINVETVLLPYELGSNLAGGVFPIIQAMIEHLSKKYKIETLICRLPSTLIASERED